MDPDVFRSVSVLGYGSSLVGGRVQSRKLLLKTNLDFGGSFMLILSSWKLSRHLILYGIRSLEIVIGDSY